MATDNSAEQWLASQPLNEAVEIDGEAVYLNVHGTGAELGAYLVHSYSQVQLEEALRKGFESAISFDAGLGQTPNGKSLVLTQWLPNVSSWSEAITPLENLLDQLSMWRLAVETRRDMPRANEFSVATRNEQRLRTMFSGAK